jgi:hypothetical protein
MTSIADSSRDAGGEEIRGGCRLLARSLVGSG